MPPHRFPAVPCSPGSISFEVPPRRPARLAQPNSSPWPGRLPVRPRGPVFIVEPPARAPCVPGSRPARCFPPATRHRGRRPGAGRESESWGCHALPRGVRRRDRVAQALAALWEIWGKTGPRGGFVGSRCSELPAVLRSPGKSACSRLQASHILMKCSAWFDKLLCKMLPVSLKASNTGPPLTCLQHML